MDKRIFLAVNLPEKLKAKIGDAIREIKSQFSEDIQEQVANWVNSDILHVTLVFIGDIKTEKLPEIITKVKEIVLQKPSFAVELKRISYGPPKAMPPRIIWLELAPNRELTDLSNDLQQQLAAEGLLAPAYQKPFLGHITLARIKPWVFKSIEPEERPVIKQDLSGEFMVQSIEVMESVLKRSGPEYFVLESIGLA